MTSSFLWKDITHHQANELNVTTDPERCRGLLLSYLRIPEAAHASSSTAAFTTFIKARGKADYEESSSTVTKEDLIMDFYFYNFTFCKEQRFSPAKTSTLLSILKTVFEQDRQRTPLGDNAMKSFARFENLLLMHSVERPPVSAGIFTPEDVKNITEYVLNEYYRHYKLYEYAFKGRVLMSLEQGELNAIEEVKEPRPLMEGLRIDASDQMINGEVDMQDGVQ